MKINDQTINLSQAKRLKDLGISQDSFFLINPKGEVLESWMLDGTEDAFYSAFTVAELGAMLPTSPKPEGGINYSYYHRNNWRGHSIGYSAPADPKNDIERPWFQNEAEARADLLIYLLEEKSITPEEANTRLSH